MSYTFNADLTQEGKRFMKALEQLEDLEVFVGLQREQEYKDGTSMVDVAAYNEFGTSTIPARPFFKQSYENHQGELQAACIQAAKTVIAGGAPDKALNIIGTFAVGLVQEEIVNGNFAPNAPSTIRKKKSDKPLIDTGQMRQGIHHVKRRKGGGGT